MEAQTPGPQNCWVDDVGSVGRRDHEHVLQILHPLVSAEPTRSSLSAVGSLCARSLGWRQSLSSDTARRIHRRKLGMANSPLLCSEAFLPLEEAADGFLTLAHVLVEQFGPLYRYEVAIRGVRNCLGQHRFAAAWRSIKQNAGLHFDVIQFAAFGVFEWLDDGVCELLFEFGQRSDVFPLGFRYRCEAVLFRRRDDLFDGFEKIFLRDDDSWPF